MKRILLLLMCCASLAKAQPDISKIEYWIDTDPGFDNAIATTGFTGTNDLNTQILASSSISTGLHTLGLRSKDVSGLWSHTNVFTILVDDTTITWLGGIEYFVDNDPGFGNAIAFSGFTSQQNVITQISANLPGNLSVGNHFIGIRSRLTNNKWSHTNSIPVYVADTASGVITRLEYFWDTDPGFGNGIDSVLASPAVDIINGIFTDSVPVSFLLNSSHVLYQRSMDSRGRWSHTNYVDNLTVNGTVDVTELEAIAGISVFPNPFIDAITIRPVVSEQARVIIYDSQGKKVVDIVLNEEKIVNTEFLTKGFYSVFTIMEKNKLYLTKLVKQ